MFLARSLIFEDLKPNVLTNLVLINKKVYEGSKCDATSHCTQPKLASAHLRHFHPGAKLLVILRNPVDRLYSSYRFYYADEPKSVDDFHNRVVEFIRGFNECRKIHSVATCTYALCSSIDG